MLQFSLGQTGRMCDGVSRRRFLQIGGLGFAGIALSDLLQLEAAGLAKPGKAVIHIYLSGGPPHQDLWDMKPDAPAEVRGEFQPISSNVPGMEMCELLPTLATMADKYTVIRSIVESEGQHHAHQVHTGWPEKDLAALGGRPAFGAAVAKLLGAGPNGVPAWVSDFRKGARHRDPVGFLGPTFKPYSLAEGDGAASLKLLQGLSEQRLSRRTNLREQLNGLRREIDASGQMQALDDYTRTAVEIVTSGRVADALDYSKEDPRVIERYAGASALHQGRGDVDLRQLLVARRLVQAGVRCVTLSNPFGHMDTHEKNFSTMREVAPRIDRGLAALIWDLERLGMTDDVTVIAIGEFGRTPKINANAGRDHWPKVNLAFLSGGGMKMGQYIGATDRLAGEVVENPIHLQRVMGQLYRNLGIDVGGTTLRDPAGRPQYLLDHREPIHELA